MRWTSDPPVSERSGWRCWDCETGNACPDCPRLLPAPTSPLVARRTEPMPFLDFLSELAWAVFLLPLGVCLWCWDTWRRAWRESPGDAISWAIIVACLTYIGGHVWRALA